MEIKKRTEKVGMSKANPIAEISFEKGTIFILEGNKGNNKKLDLFIKYTDRNNKKGKPKYVGIKHTHWVVDFLLKKEHKKKLLIDFVNVIKDKYDEFKKKNPLQKRNFNNIKKFLNSNKFEDNNKFKKLNKFGKYDVEFIYYLLILFAVNELNSCDNPYMFHDSLDLLTKNDSDFRDILDLSTGGKWNG